MRVDGADIDGGINLAAAKKKFVVGKKVKIKAASIEEAAKTRAEWRYAHVWECVVVEVLGFRDSKDHPIVCVALPSLSHALIGWWKPEDLEVVS
jgi:hypothetical protein